MKMPRPKTLLLISACTAVLTIILKMGAWYVTGSVGLLSDGLESFVNLAGAVFALLMVTIAERPADADHPHGHHKAEYFSSGFEGVLIFAAALGILWTAIDRLFHPHRRHKRIRMRNHVCRRQTIRNPPRSLPRLHHYRGRRRQRAGLCQIIPPERGSGRNGAQDQNPQNHNRTRRKSHARSMAAQAGHRKRPARTSTIQSGKPC